MNTIVENLEAAKLEIEKEYTFKRDKLDEMIVQAKQIFGEGGGSASASAPSEGKRLKAGKVPKAKRVPIGEKINRTAKGGVLVHLPAVRGLKEPFTAPDVERVCKLDKKKASNLITGLKLKGWVVNSAYGEYQRTPAFGGIQLADIHAGVAAGKKPKED